MEQKSLTPIYDFVKKYAESNRIRAHMPGHKGNGFLGLEALDITEIDGADTLYQANGIIKQSEELASSLFGTAKTLYSAQGSSLSIKAMLYLVTLYAKSSDKKPVVYAFRNAHKSFISACALLNFEIVWLYSSKNDGIISCDISSAELEERLNNSPEPPTAIYITSPDYLGNIADISEISKVCKSKGILLCVDNAHGAYLNFLPQSRHPIALGADICCDSAHKTLPVLTGGGYLHISKNAPVELLEHAENAMQLFASTSPSYLIMQSLDLANAYIVNGYREKLQKLCLEIARLKERLIQCGFTLCGDEPTKLTICAKPYGYTGNALCSLLEMSGIVCEFCDPDYVVLMLTVENHHELEAIEKALVGIKQKPPIEARPPQACMPTISMTPARAVFSKQKKIKAAQSLGCVLASVTVSCPPAIPIVVCGEVIDNCAVELFEYYGIDSVWVVD